MTPEENNTIVAARGLGRRVTTAAGPLDILSDIDLGINAAESVAIVGVSGSGKSTLLGLLAGLDLPSSGEVWLAGQRLNDLDEDGRARVRGQLTGFVFQSFQLLPALTANLLDVLPLTLALTGLGLGLSAPFAVHAKRALGDLVKPPPQDVNRSSLVALQSG